jgi:RNA polymerase primary sigma factor
MAATTTRPAPHTKSSRSTPSKSTRERPEMTKRVEQLVSTEIGFVDNPTFRVTTQVAADVPELVALVENEVYPRSLTRDVQQLSSNLKPLCEFPVLQLEDEQQLFRQMNFHKFRANQLRVLLASSPRKRSYADELENCLERSLRLRNYLVLCNLRLVMSIAKQFINHSTTFDMAFSEGVGCLINAVEKYDFSRGFRFSTYATSAIRRELYRLMIKNHQRQQRYVTGSSEVSLDLQDTSAPASSTAEQQSQFDTLLQMMERLDEREQLILKSRFGFDKSTGQKTTYTEIGKRLGVSKERVRQIAERALGRLRELAPGFGLDASLVS